MKDKEGLTDDEIQNLLDKSKGDKDFAEIVKKIIENNAKGLFFVKVDGYLPSKEKLMDEGIMVMTIIGDTFDPFHVVSEHHEIGWHSKDKKNLKYHNICSLESELSVFLRQVKDLKHKVKNGIAQHPLDANSVNQNALKIAELYKRICI